MSLQRSSKQVIIKIIHSAVIYNCNCHSRQNSKQVRVRDRLGVPELPRLIPLRVQAGLQAPRPVMCRHQRVRGDPQHLQPRVRQPLGLLQVRDNMNSELYSVLEVFQNRIVLIDMTGVTVAGATHWPRTAAPARTSTSVRRRTTRARASAATSRAATPAPAPGATSWPPMAAHARTWTSARPLRGDQCVQSRGPSVTTPGAATSVST